MMFSKPSVKSGLGLAYSVLVAGILVLGGGESTAQGIIEDCGYLEAGVEGGCMVFASNQHGSFDVKGDLGGFQDGDCVCIWGEVDSSCLSICQTGPCIYPLNITYCYEYTCGDLDYSGDIDIGDFTMLINCLYITFWPLPPVANIDGVPGVTHNDGAVLMDAFRTMMSSHIFCHGIPWPDCNDVVPDSSYPPSPDSIILLNTIVPPGNGTWIVPMLIRAVEPYCGISVPFSFSCPTSPLQLDTIILALPHYLEAHGVADNGRQCGIMAAIGWVGCPSGPDFPAGKSLLATLHFTIEESLSEQIIEIDTSASYPEYTTVLSRCTGVTPAGFRPHFWSDPDGCCRGFTGNVDCDYVDQVDIGDVTEMIRVLFIDVGDEFCCWDGANLDYNEGIDVGDLTILIKHLFIDVTPPPPCP